MTKHNSSNSSKGKSGNTKQISPAKHWVFTLNNHTLENIKNIEESSSIKRYSFQEETGESGTPHLQGYIEFITKRRPKSIFENFNAHWEKCKRIKDAIAYTQKEDTRTGNQYLKGIKKIRPLSYIKYDDLYPWQKKISDLCKTEPDDRTINWLWEQTGNVGKSALVRHLCIMHGALLVSGKAADIKYQIANAREVPEIIIWDIPRTARNYVNYCALEEVKNGCFASNKYESKMIIINSPHVICFANFEPEYANMSEDRWKVQEI
jgi:hypothetical protein